MKLAFIINVFREDNFHSGGERLYYEFVKKAIQDGHTVDLYCTKFLYAGTKVSKLNINTLTILGHSKDYKNPQKIERLYDLYKSLLKNKDYDYVISENIVPPIDIGIFQGHSQKHYIKMSGNIFSKFLYKIKKRKHLKYQEKWLKNGFNKIFTPSNILKKDLIENFNLNNSRISVIYPGVKIPTHINEFDFDKIKNSEYEIKIGLSAPSFGKKGGFIALKAFSILKNQRYKFKAKIIYQKAKNNIWVRFLVRFYGLKKVVEFLPYQNEMQEFYNSVDCVIMPSLLETFGLVAIEAMANKRPIIVSDLCGISEIIHNNENGLIFNMKNKPEKNLANALKNIFDDREKLETLSKNAYKTALEYSWDKAYKRFISLIEK
ncbi:MAG: glycosyltransferase family 4 protein [Candidatus Gastranaerophilales bacterium]|nr:glycosyltransferase family 4 protein [Candidatus Gastranaerophilales bacterium]